MNSTFHCPSCGAPLDPPVGRESTIRCPFCATSVIVPNEIRQQVRSSNTISRAQAIEDFSEPNREMREIIQLLNWGKKEEAIERFRQVFNRTRAEAVITIEAIENKQIVQVTHSKVISGSYSTVDQPQAVNPIKPAALRNLGKTCLGLVIAGILLSILLGIGVVMMMQPGGLLYGVLQQINPPDTVSTLLSFGEEGLMPGQLTDPTNVAVDLSGNIFVSDFKTGRIQQFDSQGQFVHLWDIADGEMIIWALELDQDGILYAATPRSILRIDTKTNQELAPIPNPNDYFIHDMKLLSNGDICMIVNMDMLVRMDQTGKEIWAVDEAIKSVIDRPVSGGKLTVDGENNIYITDTYVYAIVKYSSQGKYINSWGSNGEDEGQFEYIRALGVNHLGQLVISDDWRLEVYERDGRFVEQINPNGLVDDLQFDADGNLYLVRRTGSVEKLHLISQNP